MKRRIYTTVLLTAIVLTVQAQTQRGIDALEQAVHGGALVPGRLLQHVEDLDVAADEKGQQEI